MLMHDDPVKQADSATAVTRHSSRSDNSTEFAPTGRSQLNATYPLHSDAYKVNSVFFSSVLNMWVVSSYEDILTVLKNPQHFSSALGYDMKSGSEFLGLTPEAQELMDSV